MVFTGVRVDSNSGPQGGSMEFYRRHVLGVNGTVVGDKETLVGRPIERHSVPVSGAGAGYDEYAGTGSIRRMLGRGPRLLGLPPI